MAIEDIVARFNTELDAAIGRVMENDVATMVRVAMANAVETEVYDAYTPAAYWRRGDYGGLIDQSPDNMVAQYDPTDMLLTVQNMNRDDETGRLVAPVVESGHGYKYHWKGQRPRPFHSVAQKNVVDDGWFEGALKSGLRTEGFKVD